MTIYRSALFALALGLAPGAYAQPAAAKAAAQPAAKAAAQPLETTLEARKVVTAGDGKETTAPAATARPGDVIEYVATYRNTGKQPLAQLEATLPIPANTEFMPGTERPATAKASLDGRSFQDMPLKRRVRRNGVEVEEQVPVREYRYLRWYPGALAGEKAVTYAARVRVVDDRAPIEPGNKGGGK